MNRWKVVCPDGQERHYPYINHGDAAFDAKVFDRDETCVPGATAEHKVVPCVAALPQPIGQC